MAVVNTILDASKLESGRFDIFPEPFDVGGLIHLCCDMVGLKAEQSRVELLKRHLRAHFGLSPDDYRLKWGLGRDYPMVAPNYARARSDLAKSMGLGQLRRHRA